MSDDELKARFNVVNANVDKGIGTVLLGIGLTFVILLFAIVVYAAPTPKPTPGYTGNFCVNLRSGAIRSQLIINNVVQACHKTEFVVGLINFDSAPTPSPGPTVGAPAPTPTADPSTGPTPNPTPSANPTPTADPTASATPGGNGMSGTVIDANGKVVGQIDQDSSDAAQGSVVDFNILGTPLGLLVSGDGFVDEQLNGVQLVKWYESANCTGIPYTIVAGDGNGQDIQPLIEVPAVQRGAYVFGTTMIFGAKPWAEHTFGSLQAFADPSQQATTPCETPGPSPNFGTWLAGPQQGFDLSTLGFTAPFSVQ